MTLAQELEALIAKATPGDLSTAEVVGGEETVECPLCSGQGEVPQDAHYTNFDAVALGVQFFGIGPHFEAHQALWSWLMKHRETILAALKDRDVVLEEAASICAVMAEDYITGQSKLGEGMPRNAAIAGILQSAEANILALKERV